MRATKMRNKGKDRTITSRAREPDEVCGGEMKSSLSVVKVRHPSSSPVEGAGRAWVSAPLAP